MVKFFLNYWQILLLLLLTTFAVLPLTHSGFFPMHDDEQIGRLYDLDTAIKAFQIPPRLSQNLGFGFDYPLFNFYPPLVYYIAEIFVLLGFSYINSIKIMIGLGFFLAAVGIYLFTKEYIGKNAALLSGIAYTYAPYHSVDAYVRGALPEFWSYTILPYLFWIIYKLITTGKTIYIPLTALVAALLLFSHNLVAMMAVLYVTLYTLYLLFSIKDKKRTFFKLMISGFLAIGISAYFWIPAILEKHFTMVDLLTMELANYNLHFVYLRQLWETPWGYGGSVYGLEDGLSFEIGKVHLILSIIGIVSCFILWKKKAKYAFIAILFSMLFLLSIFFMTFYSKKVWDIVQPFWYIQFPWRFLLFTAFTSSFLLSVPLLLLKKHQKIASLYICISMVLLLIINIPYFKPEKYFSNVTDKDYIALDVIRWRTSIMAFEYTPRGIATKKSSVGNTVIDITKDQIAKKSVNVLSGDMNISERYNTPQEKIWIASVKKQGQLSLNTFAFPGWQVYVNGKKFTFTSNNKYKLITVSLPKGEYKIHAIFERTFVRKIAEIISIISGIIIILFFCLPVYRLYKK